MYVCVLMCNLRLITIRTVFLIARFTCMYVLFLCAHVVLGEGFVLCCQLAVCICEFYVLRVHESCVRHTALYDIKDACIHIYVYMYPSHTCVYTLLHTCTHYIHARIYIHVCTHFQADHLKACVFENSSANAKYTYKA